MEKKTDLVCDTCGKHYQRFNSQANKGRRSFCSRDCCNKHGLKSVKCSWLGCDEHIPCRTYKFTTGKWSKTGEVYKTDLVRRGNYTSFPMCQFHLERMAFYLGKNRFNIKRSRMLASPDRDYGVRSLSSRFSRMLVFEKSHGRCSGCGIELDWNAPPKTWQVDHIVPVFRGGLTSFVNLQVLCQACHDDKSALEKSEAAKERHLRTKTGRWLTHSQKDELIARLRARLSALGQPTD